MIELCAIGGYDEVGKNMTAIKIDDDVIIFDMGIHLEPYIELTEDEEIHNISTSELLKVGAIPDDSVIKSWKHNVKAIIPTHAHLDHIGAIMFLAEKYKAPIIATPYTVEVIKTIMTDEKIKLQNKIKILNTNSSHPITNNIKVEFVNITHSTPQTVIIALHTKYGIIMYANDYKLDNHPTLGRRPNYKRLKELGKQNVIALICDCTRAKEAKKTPSEYVAREMLRDVLLTTGAKCNNIIMVTTFSSHIARLKSIIECGRKINRKIVFLGRSLSKYVLAAEKVGIVNFSKQVEIVKYSSNVKKRLRKIDKEGREKYLVVLTGHQGEPKSILSKIVRKEIPFSLYPEDIIIFSSTVIPTKVNMENRKLIEEQLENYNVRIFKDIHVSGHGAREDHREFFNLTKPKNIIPAHGDKTLQEAMASLAIDKGYKLGKSIHLLRNGQKIRLL